MGPRVDQPNATDPTKTVVSWKGMVNNPECADAIRVWVWRKDIDAMTEKQVLRRLTGLVSIGPDGVPGPLPLVRHS